jgi:hypothetical protein
MDEFSYEHYVWRGALGGAIGYLLLEVAAIVYYWTYSGSQGPVGKIVAGGVFGLIGGAITGIVIGFLIWRITLKMGKEPSTIIRFCIGTCAFLIYYLLTHLYPYQEVRPLFALIFAILGGGLSGLLAHRKDAASLQRRV